MTNSGLGSEILVPSPPRYTNTHAGTNYRAGHCGTYVNQEIVPSASSSDKDDISLASRALSNGDIISLGKSQINSFVFVDTRI